jgi:hypothetical protein
MMVDTNILVAPPYIHRYTENNQNGWRIQPNGYIEMPAKADTKDDSLNIGGLIGDVRV